jgi:hypothetical protein
MYIQIGTFIQNRFQEMWSVLDFVRRAHVLGLWPRTLKLQVSAQVVPGLVGEYKTWKSEMADTVDRGMDQKATVEDIARRKVSRRYEVIRTLSLIISAAVANHGRSAQDSFAIIVSQKDESFCGIGGETALYRQACGPGIERVSLPPSAAKEE